MARIRGNTGQKRPVPQLSVIIPAKDRKADLEKCLKAVKTSLARARISHEVIVVDDGSRDATPQAVISASRNWDSRGRLKLIRHRVSRGPAAARNTGARTARGPVLFFTDSDCLPSPFWIGELLSTLARHPECVMAEGKTLASPPPPHPIYSHVVENIRGKRWLTCNLAVRRTAFMEAGGFDERYRHPVREDTDFAFAIIKKGGKSLFNPRALVRHPVKQGKAWSVLDQSWQAKYDPLLFLKYPVLYFTRLKWIDGWFFPFYHLGFYAVAGWLAYSAFHPSILTTTNLALMAFVGLASLGATMLARLRRRKIQLLLLPILAIESVIVPFTRMFWTITGFVWAGSTMLRK